MPVKKCDSGKALNIKADCRELAAELNGADALK